MRARVGGLDSSGTVRIPELDVALFGWSWRRLRFEGFSYRYNRDGVLWMDRLDQLEPSRASSVSPIWGCRCRSATTSEATSEGS